MDNKEIRTIDESVAEVRAIGSSRNVEGFGIVFNSESNDLGGFTEVILPEAMDGVIERSDVLALMNHDINRGVLARSTKGHGSLKLSITGKGVKYAFEAPSFDLGNELVEGIRRGDIKASSFAFKIANGGSRMERRSNGSYLRTISQFAEISDMSPCYREAYEDTSVALRSLEEFRNIEKSDLLELEEVKPVVATTTPEPITKPTFDELGAYYSKLDEQINNLKKK